MASVNVAIVVGRADAPTDGVLDYSEHLSDALRTKGHSVSVVHRVDVGRPWRDAGWSERSPFAGVPEVVLLQYTNLAWSNRGFPIRVLPLAKRAKSSARSLVVTIHDGPFESRRLVDRVRAFTQSQVIRSLLKRADAAVFTTRSAQNALSLNPRKKRQVVIPVGSNIRPVAGRSSEETRIAVFGVTEGDQAEATFLGEVFRLFAATRGPVRVSLVGRGTSIAVSNLGVGSEDGVEVEALGVVPEKSVADVLAKSTLGLHVRGASTRRGSLIAMIAAGLPVVATANEETDDLIRQAGVRIVPARDSVAAASALADLAKDPDAAARVREHEAQAMSRYFSWSAIAEAYEELF
jgi:hypothetical protein